VPDLLALVAGFAVGAGVVVAVLSARRGTPQVVPARTPSTAPPPARRSAAAPPAAAGMRVNRPVAAPPAAPRSPASPASGPAVARLTVDGTRTSVVLESDGVTIGRGSDQSLRVSDSKASRAHAVVRPRRKGGWQLEDVGSANGTRVNDQRIPEGRVVPLRDGDRIGIGSTTIRYSEQATPGGTAPDATQVLR
jgi:FHA domain